jgi:NodT family efflux transporter outer membrane factor (OMF) lipoprotein
MKPSKPSSALLVGGVFCLVALSGCVVGPNYRRPNVDTSISFKEAGDWKPAEPVDYVPRGRWWEAFQDPVLDRLEARIDVSNNTLAVAEAQLRQAQAAAAAAHAALFPTLSATLSASRSKEPARSGTAASSAGSAGSAGSVGSAADWELDLWGRLRRNQEAGRALADASAADLESARLSLHATFAQTYFALRTADAQKQLLDRLSQGYAQFLDLTKNRYAQGVAARSDVVSAEAQLKAIEAQRIDLGVIRAQLEHSLAAILGKAPANFTLPPTAQAPKLPDPPIVVPSALLERRPDIAAAERRLAAASAQIGVAQAGYFPTISLSGSAGAQTSDLAHLISTPNAVWAIGSSVAQSIFDAGKVRAAVAQARAAYDGSVGAYRQTVLTAFQDAEDSLAEVRTLEEEMTVQDQAVSAARETVGLTQNQYKAGTQSHLNVITAQAALLDAERASVTLSGRRFDAATLLFKAMAGGW